MVISLYEKERTRLVARAAAATATAGGEKVVVIAPPELRRSPSFNPVRSSVIRRPKLAGSRVGHKDPSKNLVCLCEKVTEAEICDAVHRALPVIGTMQVKKRTRAGMGRCQGFFCGERVAAMVARETGLPLSDVQRRTAGSGILPHIRMSTEERRSIAKL
jgi:glycerol-3-phosphate dehydrogenase